MTQGGTTRVRLVVTGLAPNVWVQLEPETSEEMSVLEACVARAEWTNGRGEAAIATLRALAERLGYPVGAPERRVPPRLVVVRRDHPAVYARLTAMARRDATVIWDRRVRDRRTAVRPAVVDRRRQSRRGAPPDTWRVLGFVMVQREDALL
jgi:hypothetical protein